jgi:hypothetical protein
VVGDVTGIAHHDDTTKRLGGGDALVVDGKGVERAIWNVLVEWDNSQPDIG